MHRHDPHDIRSTVAPIAMAPSRWLRLAGQGLAATGLIGALSLAAHEMRLPERPAVAAPAAITPDFVPSAASRVRPAVSLAASAPRFRLDDPDALDPVKAEPARLDPATGRREDSLSQGSFLVGEAPYLRLAITEGGPADAPSLFVILARRAADGQGLAVVRTGERGRIATKFGPVETLEATFSGPVSRICTGFSNRAQIDLDPAAPRLDGWLCAPLGQAPEPRAIACALDKLALNGQASPVHEAAYRVFEDRRRPDCAPALGDAPKRDAGGVTGSIARRPLGHNKAKLRQTAQARP